MILSKTVKYIVGIATLIVTLLPFVAAVGWMGMMFMPFFGLLSTNEEQIGRLFPLFGAGYMLFMLTLMCTAVLSVALRIFYIIHVIKNERGDDTIRILCAVGFMFMPFIAYPVYYFLYIWPDEPPQSALKKPAIQTALQ